MFVVILILCVLAQHCLAGSLIVLGSLDQITWVGSNGLYVANFNSSSGGGSGSTNSDQSLVGWWKLDGNLTDFSASGNNGTGVGNPQFVSGTNGQALLLNGSSQYVDVGNSAIFNITNVWTLTAWVNFTAIPTGGNYQFWFGKDDDALGESYDFGTENDFSGAYPLMYINGSGTTLDFHPFSNSTWYFVAAVANGTSVTYYVNGSPGTSFTEVVPIVSTSHLCLGARSYSTSHVYFSGMLQDMRIYNTNKSSAFISGLYSSGPQ